MTTEKTKKYQIATYVVVGWMLIGLIAVSGGMLAKSFTENELGDLFNVIIYPIIFALLPLLFLKHN